jgi:hypothetical protein
MTWSVGEYESPASGTDLAICYVDCDALLPLCAQAVGEKRVFDTVFSANDFEFLVVIDLCVVLV